MAAGVPCLIRAGLSYSLPALLACYHPLKTSPCTGTPRRPRKPRKESHQELVYGRMVKKQHKGHRKEVVSRILCGAERLEALLYQCA